MGDDGTTVGGAHVEEHPLRVVVLIVVAVHAMVLFVGVAAVVLVDGGLREVGQVALVESQLAVELIAGLDEAVGEERVDGFLGHMQLEGGMAHPALLAAGIDAHCDVLAPMLGQQLAPCGGVEIHLAVRGSAADEATEVGHEGIGCIIDDHEVQWSDIGRNGDTLVVGINPHCLLHVGEGGGDGRRTVRAGREK